MLLDGKVAVLSGVGPGLGRESALVFAREGASVVLVARDERRIAAVGREVEQAGGRAFDVNVFGTLRMTRAVAVLMAERGAGSIVMVNSIASAGTMPRIADYTGSKAALAGMTRTLARELGPHGIRVNGIHPGTMWGPYNERRFQAMADENGTTLQAEHDRAAAEVPLRYLPGSNEVAEVLAFFASDRARAITGQRLHVNAGQYFG
jgi:NAD(P)-dependent dehydrogenase (short-subunit alcohol dehydrogenase family)